MSNFRGASLLMLGLITIVGGWFVQSGVLEWLLNVIGFIMIVTGILASVVGLIQMLSGGGRRRRY